MKLFFRSQGNGFPLIILHGLYGASDNWMTIAKHLSKDYQVIIPDLRNHGQSPHDDEMNFDAMAEDILELCKLLKTKKCILLGHSMGGKLAIQIALNDPQLVDKLIVVDVAPKSYLEGYSKHFELHKIMINILNQIDLKTISSRKEAEKILNEKIESVRTVKFLLKSLTNTKGRGFQWKFNVYAIHRNLYKLIDGIDENDTYNNRSFGNPTLFIRGGESDYILETDIPAIRKIFSDLKIETIPDAGHWLHTEKMDEFLELVFSFISEK